jgi:hypothetical protein
MRISGFYEPMRGAEVFPLAKNRNFIRILTLKKAASSGTCCLPSGCIFIEYGFPFLKILHFMDDKNVGHFHLLSFSLSTNIRVASELKCNNGLR